MNIEDLYSQYLKSRRVSIDSRAVTENCIFFGLKGEHGDGGSYAAVALEHGASLCVIENPEYKVDERCIVVDNSLKTLQDLSKYHRQHLDIPVIGITGTNGKTTTKELTNAVLSKKYKTWCTQGNLNNHIGVPLTILSTPENTEVLIVEMGANHPGEIEFLCNIANPDHGVISNVGRAHLEGFGSFKGVVKTKCELYKHLAAMAGTIFVNAEDEILMERAEKFAVLPSIPSMLPGVVPPVPLAMQGRYGDDFKPRGVNMPMASVVSYGNSDLAEYAGHSCGANPYLEYVFVSNQKEIEVSTRLFGEYNFPNAMAATCIGEFFGVNDDDIRSAIESYIPSNNRSQYIKTARNTVVLDCYNANPSSMNAAINSFKTMKGENKVVFLGGMRELGISSAKEHRSLFDLVASHNYDLVVLVGEEFKFAKGMSHTLWFPTSDDARKHFEDNPLSGKTILLKGSNSNRMWVIEPAL